MDEHNLLAFESDFCVAVVGRGSEFCLISTADPIDNKLCEQALARGFSYCGVLGFIQGHTRAKCQDAASLETMIAAAGEFAALAAARIRSAREAEELNRLYAREVSSDEI